MTPNLWEVFMLASDGEPMRLVQSVDTERRGHLAGTTSQRSPDDRTVPSAGLDDP